MNTKWLNVLCLSLLVCVCWGCSEDKDKLETKWQLREYQYADGLVQRIDSVFYNFQKGSFSAICLLPDKSYLTFFGNYSLSDDKISIILLPESEGPVYDKYFGWPNGERVFQIEELTSSVLRLRYEDRISVLRKY